MWVDEIVFNILLLFGGKPINGKKIYALEIGVM